MSIRSIHVKNLLSPYVISNWPWLERLSTYKKSARNLEKVIYFGYHPSMEPDLFEPPRNLHGMKVLNKDDFNKTFAVLSVEAEENKILELLKILKKYVLKIYRVKAVQPVDKDNFKKLLFNPLIVRKISDFDTATQKMFEDLNLNADRFTETTVNLTYDNYIASTVLKAVLPSNEPALTAFSIIGHIVHVNLKPHLFEFKSIIGQILFEKTPNIRTVVNKASRIDSVYRNFEIELLYGEPDYIVNVKENGCSFKFDFSKVYWNPRLGTEHARVIESLNMKDALFDVFCGVGPFSIPAAKKKCHVYSNDLNPESIKWLTENIKLNKVSCDNIQIFNRDGSDFIENNVKMNLVLLWKNELFNGKIVVVMNLPALALDFLKCFKGLLKSEINDLDIEVVKNNLPIVHCYFFAQNADNKENLIFEKTGIDLNNTEHDISLVRKVSGSKEMYKIKLQLPLEYMISDSWSNQNLDSKTRESSYDEPKAKRVCKSDLNTIST